MHSVTIKQNLVSGKGESFTLNIEFTDSAGTPVDLTGHTVAFVVEKSKVGTAVGTYPASVDNAGNISINVPDEVTATWPVGKLAYRVVHTNPSGDKKWLVYGALTIMDGNDV